MCTHELALPEQRSILASSNLAEHIIVELLRMRLLSEDIERMHV